MHFGLRMWCRGSDHAEASREKGWSLPASGETLTLKGLTPFWLDRGSSVPNDVSLDEGQMAFFNGPTPPAKVHTVEKHRRGGVAGASGLCAPITEGEVPHWDGILLRHATGDAPSYGKSSFEREMDAVAQLFRECTSSSLVLVDELGSGTSSSEGAAVGGAVLDELTDRKMRGVFATHLHEILEEDDRSDVEKWRMGGDHSCAEGVCVDSLALHAAVAADVPSRIVERAALTLGRDVPSSTIRMRWTCSPRPLTF